MQKTLCRCHVLRKQGLDTAHNNQIVFGCDEPVVTVHMLRRNVGLRTQQDGIGGDAACFQLCNQLVGHPVDLQHIRMKLLSVIGSKKFYMKCY